MTGYTVLLLRPDTDWNGHASDWILREHVTVRAGDIVGAVKQARSQASEVAGDAAAEFTGGDRLTAPDRDDYAILAVYPGHHWDEYVNGIDV